MKEYRNAQMLWTVNHEIAIDETVCVGGYEYKKIADREFENNASKIIIIASFDGVTPVASFLEFKKNVRKSATRNQFGQILR